MKNSQTKGAALPSTGNTGKTTPEAIMDPIANRERLFNNALEDALSNRR